MTKKDQKIDFFIVGAPKCGTTSMHNYLRQNPLIYLPEVKDRPFFGNDIYQDMDEESHSKIYIKRNSYQTMGETCVWYLKSRSAQKQIKKHNSEAKIIIMLRSPVDVLYSHHSEMLFSKAEREKDFMKALVEEKERKVHDNMTGYDHFGRTFTYYSDVVKFASQVTRYFDAFGKNNVHVIIFEDFTSDTKSSYQKTLRFLEISNNFVPKFQKHNPNKISKHGYLQGLITQPPLWLRQYAHKYLPYKLRHLIVKKTIQLNTKYKPRKKMSPKDHAILTNQFSREINKLERLLDRDLSMWYKS